MIDVPTEWIVEWSRRNKPDRYDLDIEERFYHYRNHGLDPDQAFRAAVAWGRNRDEQTARRIAHDTGCERHPRW